MNLKEERSEFMDKTIGPYAKKNRLVEGEILTKSNLTKEDAYDYNKALDFLDSHEKTCGVWECFLVKRDCSVVTGCEIMCPNCLKKKEITDESKDP